jgi:hypothetical protein
MSESKLSPRRVLAAQRRREAIRLRIEEGATFAKIGQALGVSEVGAYKMVQKGLALINQKMAVDAEALRTETVRQLEALLAVHLPKALQGDVKSGNLAIRALAERAKITGVIKAQAVVAAANPYEGMSPDELRAEAHRLGIYEYPHEVGTVDHLPEPATPPIPSANGTGTNGHSPLSWPRRNNDGSLMPR